MKSPAEQGGRIQINVLIRVLFDPAGIFQIQTVQTRLGRRRLLQKPVQCSRTQAPESVFDYFDQ